MMQRKENKKKIVMIISRPNVSCWFATSICCIILQHFTTATIVLLLLFSVYYYNVSSFVGYVCVLSQKNKVHPKNCWSNKDAGYVFEGSIRGRQSIMDFLMQKEQSKKENCVVFFSTNYNMRPFFSQIMEGFDKYFHKSYYLRELIMLGKIAKSASERL